MHIAYTTNYVDVTGPRKHDLPLLLILSNYKTIGFYITIPTLSYRRNACMTLIYTLYSI